MVSIIVPVYKSEKTLRRCVESLCRQAYADIEILLIVDGPPDGSGILADQLAKEDARIRVINQPNRGVSRARNRGLTEAAGEYIRFVDSDDYVLYHGLDEMVRRIEQDRSDLVIAGFDHLYFGQKIEKLPHTNACMELRSSYEDLKQLYKGGFLNMPWNKLYKKELIREQFPVDLNLGEDLLFNEAYIRQTARISVLQQPVCEYIQDDRGTTLSTKKRNDKVETALLLYEKTKAFFQNCYPDVGQFAFLADKVCTTFLDEVEGLGFAKDMTYAEKRAAVAEYAKQTRAFLQREGIRKPELTLLDYRIVFFFLRRQQISMTMLMIRLRAMVVEIVRRGKGV